METNTCRREECGNAATKQRLCHTHYLEEWYAAKTEPCSMSECERKAWSKGLCLMHYKRQWRHGSPHILVQVGADMPLAERVNRIGWTVTDSGCWEWNGRRDDKGYGQLDYAGTSLGAHRASYIVFKGAIDDGLFVCHSCDNPPCMNPEHLWLGTNKENLRDMASKNRGGIAKGERNGFSKLDEESVRVIRRLRSEGKSLREIGSLFNVTEACVSQVARRVSWRHVN